MKRREEEEESRLKCLCGNRKELRCSVPGLHATHTHSTIIDRDIHTPHRDGRSADTSGNTVETPLKSDFVTFPFRGGRDAGNRADEIKKEERKEPP